MFDKNLLINLSLVLLWTYFDLRRAYLQPNSNPTDENLVKIHGDFPTVSPPQLISTIKIHYCERCGYRHVLEDFSELIRRYYPNMKLVEIHHKPSPLRILLAKILSMMKIVFLICFLFGLNPFPLFHISTPRVYLWALQNRMYASLMIFFLSSLFESYLMSTGAFEISINDVPLWSKLNTGRLPSTDELMQMLKSYAN